MFRELTRIKQKLSQEACLEILRCEKRGVLSVNGDNGYPYGMPMNHYYDSQSGCIYFHSGKRGHRTDALLASNKVSFCVYDSGTKRDGHWSLDIKSVIVFGKIELITDIDEIVDISTKLSHKFTLDEEYIRHEIERSAKATLLLRLTPEHICGKIVNES